MSLGPIMLDIAGTELTAEDREVLRHPLVGGLIFFNRNYESPEQIKALCVETKALRQPSLLLAVDQEGGRVQRFNVGFTRLPPLGLLDQIYKKDATIAPIIAEQVGYLMAAELRQVGIDISFAPVLDLNRGNSKIIGDRSLGRQPGQVIELATSYIEGMAEAGMAATGKHFPGHGAVSADSHVAVPVDERDLDTIMAEDGLPFQELAARLHGIMPAHIIYRGVDESPAGFSQLWLKKILREQLGYQGIIFSDDLSMEGASVVGDMVDRAHAALEAGCDMILTCNNRPETIKVLDNLTTQSHGELSQRIQRLYGKPHKVDVARLTQAQILIDTLEY